MKKAVRLAVVPKKSNNFENASLEEMFLNEDVGNVFYRCVEDCNETIMISDLEGKLIYVNPAWCRTYGYSREEAIGKTPALLHSGYQNEAFYKSMWAAIRDPEAGHWTGELFNKTKDGSLVPVYLTITPFRNEEGSTRGFMGIALDMRAQKSLEAKVMHQDKLASIGLIASGLAHEIGTPLSVIRGRAELMLSGAGDVKKNLEIITQQIDRVSYFIQSLLNIGRPTTEVDVGHLNINEIIENVSDLMGQTFKREGIELKKVIDAKLNVLGERKKVEQILLNFLTNALHAIKKVKESTPDYDGKVIFSAEKRQENVIISVIDNGIGISTEQMKNLFQPFYTTKDVGEGTGLGLPIALQIAQSLGGNIAVESTPGNATRFDLILRLA